MRMNWISKNRPTKKQDLIDALDEMSELMRLHGIRNPSIHAYDQILEVMTEQIGKLRSLVDHLPEHECTQCHETNDPCACMRNKCVRCGKPVGNVTFTLCDDCWENRKKVMAEDKPVVKQLCNNCVHRSDEYHELDPLGEWKWCERLEIVVHEDIHACKSWKERVLTWPEDK